MPAKPLLLRILTVMGMTIFIFILLTVMRAQAMPIRPDVRKLLSEPRVPATDFAPARAGWNGPESGKAARPVNLTYDQLGPAGTAREVRSSLLAAALPDYRVLAAILLVILLLRRMRQARLKAEAGAATPAVAMQTGVPVPAVPVPPGETGENRRAA
jgi:hypothetical protein